MRGAISLLLLLITNPAWSQPAATRGPFDTIMAASVVSAALAFITPRALDPVSIQQLALWGLAAPASLDGNLATELRDGTILLLRDNQPIFSRPFPTDDAPATWGRPRRRHA